MTLRFFYTPLLSWRSQLINIMRAAHHSRRNYKFLCLTHAQIPQEQSEFNHKPSTGKDRRLCLNFKRQQQTLSSDFGAQLPSVKQMEHFLSNCKILFEHGHTSLIASCPFCIKKEDASANVKDYTLYVNKTTGSYLCRKCDVSGTWQKFKVLNACTISRWTVQKPIP